MILITTVFGQLLEKGYSGFNKNSHFLIKIYKNGLKKEFPFSGPVPIVGNRTGQQSLYNYWAIKLEFSKFFHLAFFLGRGVKKKGWKTGTTQVMKMKHCESCEKGSAGTPVCFSLLKLSFSPFCLIEFHPSLRSQGKQCFFQQSHLMG